jgi:transposase
MSDVSDRSLVEQNRALRALDVSRVAELDGLNITIASQAGEIEQLKADKTSQAGEIEQLTRKVTELELRLNQGSKNSSFPPSSDKPKERAEATKSRAERRAAAKAKNKDDVVRSRGKQPGAPGKNLPMRNDPNYIVNHPPTACVLCGEDLASAPLMEGFERRQVLDTPKPIILATEHRSMRKRCTCGTVNSGVFPADATAPVSYGSNIRAATLYLLHAQHIPVERTAEAMSAMLGANVSTGFVASLARQAAGGLGGFIDEIRRRLRAEPFIHADETSDQVRTDRWWFHVASTELYTYLFASSTRGKDAPDEAGVLPSFDGVMVHDRAAMYFKYDDAAHAICLAHIVRNLASVAVGSDQGWAANMSALLIEMNEAAHEARRSGATHLPARRLEAFLARYDTLVEEGLTANPAPMCRSRDYTERKSFNLVSALRDLRTEATLFAVDIHLPATNNQAERDLRMAKLHKKISGCFQSDDGARHFAVIRSYISTARKHGVGALDALIALFCGEPWMPPNTT